ncbi:MAG: FAD-dependent oxidoreductase [Deltaproteobacteria bacterium]|nr:FAD-dependent oxidoreductase [Deltaproteobacteria bacterium]
MNSDKNVIIIGSGISGMGAAYALQKNGFNVTVLEKNGRVGGRMLSTEWHGTWIDLGAEYLSSKENKLFQLITELGLSSRVIDYPTVGQVTFESWRNDSGHVVSLSKPLSMLTTAPFSVRGKIGLAKLIPMGIAHMVRAKLGSTHGHTLSVVSSDDEESLESWLSRVHPDFLDYAIEPMHEFMWSHEPQQMSRGWALDFYVKHMRLDVCSLDEGYGLLPRVLATKLDVVTNARVGSVIPGEASVTVAWNQDGAEHRKDVDGVVVAVPGTQVKGMVQRLGTERTKFFDGVRYSPQEIPFFKLDHEISGLPMMRLYSRREDPILNAIIYTSPRPDGEKFLRAKLKAKYIKRDWQQSDDERMDAIEHEIARYFPEAVRAIEDRLLHRWEEALPIFYPGYTRSLKEFSDLPPIPGLVFAGDYLTGGDTGQAYQSGLWAAEELAKQLN